MATYLFCYFVVLLQIYSSLCITDPYFDANQEAEKVYEAIAVVRYINSDLEMVPKTKMSGVVYFSQKGLNGPTSVNGSIIGLNPGYHGVHVMELGDMQTGCPSRSEYSTYVHLNPFSSEHGNYSDDTDVKHLGDLGNILVDENGTCEFRIELDNSVRVAGKYSIVGRMISFSEYRDDVGLCDDDAKCAANSTFSANSIIDGNSGPSVACGIIGISGDFFASCVNSLISSWICVVVGIFYVFWY